MCCHSKATKDVAPERPMSRTAEAARERCAACPITYSCLEYNSSSTDAASPPRRRASAQRRYRLCVRIVPSRSRSRGRASARTHDSRTDLKIDRVVQCGKIPGRTLACVLYGYLNLWAGVLISARSRVEMTNVCLSSWRPPRSVCGVETAEHHSAQGWYQPYQQFSMLCKSPPYLALHCNNSSLRAPP